MTLTKKRLIISMFILVALVLFTNNVSFARYTYNYTEEGYDPPPPPPDGGNSVSGVMQTVSISSLIIEGAGNYMRSYSDFLLMANQLELSDLNGIDFSDAKLKVEKAITSAKMAFSSYHTLVEKANSTPYNYSVINLLVDFDYRSFKKEKAFNATVFRRVESYLSEGDLRGSYAYVLPHLENILGLLSQVYEAVSAQTLPDNEIVWRINQEFSETLLFGQYATEVFARVTNK